MEQNANISLPAFLKFDKPVNFFIGLIVCAAAFGLTYLAVEKFMDLFILGIILFFGILLLMLNYPKLWLYIISILSYSFFTNPDEGVSTLDVVYGILYILGLVLWFFWQIAVLRKKLVRNHADWIILLFFLSLPFNCFVAVMNGVLFFDWVRDYGITLILLLYFPIREYFDNKRDLAILLFLFAISVIGAAAEQFLLYSKGISTEVVYAYQIGKSVRLNQTLFTGAAITGIVFFFNIKNYFMKLLLLIFSAIAITALITSFSRTFWVVFVFIAFIMLFYLSHKQKVHFVVFSSVITIMVLLPIFFVFKDNSDIALEVIQKRFVSSAEGKQDLSVLSRLYEYEAALNKTLEFPLGGNGLAKVFYFYNPVPGFFQHSQVNHNGYIYFLYRTGIPLSICLFTFLIIYTLRSEYLARKLNDPFYKSLALSAFLMLILQIIANFTTTQFNSRDGVFVFLLSIAFIGIADKHFKSNNLQKETAEKAQSM